MQPQTRAQTVTGNSNPIMFNTYKTPFQVSIQLAIVGTSAQAKIQVTEDDLSPYTSVAAIQSNATWLDHATLSAVTTTSTGVIVSPVTAARVVVSAISSATVTTTFVQAG